MVQMKRLALVTALACASLVAAASVSNGPFHSVARAADQWRWVEDWPHMPPGKQFGTLSGVAIDKKGVVYVFERNQGGDVWMFNKSGDYLGQWAPAGKPGFVKMAHTMHIDPDGNIWITDRTGHQVKKFSPEGELLLTVGTGEPGDGPNMFNGPTGMQFFPNGDFMVSDGYWNNRVAWFNKDGKFLRSVGIGHRPPDSMEGRGPGAFGLVHAAGQLPDGRVVVSDRCDGPVGPEDETRRNPGCTDNRVQVVDKDGTFLEYWNQYHGPLCLLVVGQRLYLAEGNQILILDASTGQELEAINDGRTSTSGGAAGPHQINVDSTGDNIYSTFLGGGGRIPGAPARMANRGMIRRYTREPK